MKIMAIIGSGVKGGTIDKMCRSILNGAEKAGHQTDIIYLSDHKISPCMGCFQCLGDSNCTMEDDFNGVYQKCVESEVLILGTPIYMGNISGLMKNFFDRHNGNAMFNPPLMTKLKEIPENERMKVFLSSISKEYSPKPEIQGKKIIRVVAANKPRFLLTFSGELRTTYDALNRYIKDMNCRLHRTILFCGTQFHPEREEKILKKAFDVGMRL